jgi:hypothetical protein
MQINKAGSLLRKIRAYSLKPPACQLSLWFNDLILTGEMSYAS